MSRYLVSPSPIYHPLTQVSGSFFFSMNWAHCNNYVAKRYMQPPGLVRPSTPSPSPSPTPRTRPHPHPKHRYMQAHDSTIYFDDIKMQMVPTHIG